MPLSESEITKQVAEDFGDKLLLEKRLKRKLRLFNNSIVRKFHSDMLIGRITNAAFFEKQLQEILQIHYRAVSRKFRGRTLDRLFDSNKNTLTKLEKEKLEKAIISHISKRSIRQARIILNTTQRNMSAASLAATNETNLVERSAVASSILSGKLKSREARTASLETQAMAEARKIAEADTFSKKKPPEEVLKEWVTAGDERVRPAHVNADSQLQRSKDVFIVKGEKLQYPGDTSLGATPGNVINCRCNSVYSTS